jgi:tetratricopeptide (TPR) repeat protein
MTILGNGLSDANQHEDALSVQEAELAMERRLGASESHMLVVQSNLASSYQTFGRHEQALEMYRGVYSGNLKIDGEEHASTLVAALNTAACLWNLQRLEEVRTLLRKTIPVARRVLGESNESTLRMRSIYGQALYSDEGATLDEHREAVTTLEETARIARQVFGGAHPVTEGIERPLRKAQAALRDREV